MESVEKLYDCVCGKCGINYQSVKEMDTDGDGKCQECQQKADNIAQRVQAIMDERNKNRPLPRPREKEMPGTHYINSRDLML